MAKKQSGNNPAVSRFGRQETSRLVGTGRPRRYYLIVCEGEKTEPLYFEGLKKDLPPGVLQVTEIMISGEGDNTLNLVKKARARKSEQEKRTGLPIDQLWVVFDLDSFPTEHFNRAIELCHHEGIGCAWSNEAFELWYLLHFQFFETNIGRQRYLELLTLRLRERAGQNTQYRKNDPDFYRILKTYGNQEQAIRNAERLCAIYEDRRDFAAHNPCTKVHLLVQELNALK
ncbi:MAG TPA: RloB family protein [Saprospiraceae bacterium]|nr:RloB family protein [Saprospiraceae bacterium]